MQRTSGISMMAAGLCLMLGGAPGWAGGHPAGNDNSDSAGNTGGGTNALVTLLPGARNNTAYGSSSLFLNRTGIDNTAFGSAALQNNTAGDNTAVGSFALGLSNTAVGSNALANNNSSGFNTAVGALAVSFH
jgi:trimeric autotransporter adhesin